jgi:hypothetical protein
MPPELPNNQHALPRSRVVEVIERSQDDALAQLRKAGVPETQALLVMQRIHVFCLQTLRELDQVYREFEELVAQDPNRSEAHQAWFNDTAAGMLLQVEVACASLVSDAINKLKDEYKREYYQQREVITTVPIRPHRPSVQQSLQELGQSINLWLLAPVGLGLWFLLWWAVSSSLTWAVIAVGITAFVLWLFAKPGLWFVGIVGLFFLLMLVL